MLKNGIEFAFMSASLIEPKLEVSMNRFLPFALALCLMLASAFAWAAVKAPPEMTLGPPKGIKATKPQVKFSHDVHERADVGCTACHHNWDGQSEVKSCAAAGCHDQPGKKGVDSFYFAFHSKKSVVSCMGCHKAEKKAGNENVPVSCKSCHPKE